MWGKYWVDHMIEGGFWTKDELLPFGNFRFEDNINSTQNDVHKGNQDLDVFEILFTANNPFVEEAVQFLGPLLKSIVDHNVKARLTIKLHPLDHKDSLALNELITLYPDHCYISRHNETDLYQLFRKCKIHITQSSASIFESLAFGIPSGLIKLENEIYLTDLINKGYAKLFDTPQILFSTVNACINDNEVYNKWLNDIEKCRELFFSSNTTGNYSSFLNQLKKSGL
jgi:hypothetical protein